MAYFLFVPRVALNSEILDNLKSHPKHLDDSAKKNVCCLIENHLSLFVNTQSHTTVLEHDIDVGGHPLINQHA